MSEGRRREQLAACIEIGFADAQELNHHVWVAEDEIRLRRCFGQFCVFGKKFRLSAIEAFRPLTDDFRIPCSGTAYRPPTGLLRTQLASTGTVGLGWRGTALPRFEPTCGGLGNKVLGRQSWSHVTRWRIACSDCLTCGSRILYARQPRCRSGWQNAITSLSSTESSSPGRAYDGLARACADPCGVVDIPVSAYPRLDVQLEGLDAARDAHERPTKLAMHWFERGGATALHTRHGEPLLALVGERRASAPPTSATASRCASL